MKKYFMAALTFSMLLLLSGCCLSHEWVEADCTTPKTCVKCETTEGESLGHQWADATCTAPKTCTVCAAIEGQPLEHDFGEEEMQNPDYVNASVQLIKTCVELPEASIVTLSNTNSPQFMIPTFKTFPCELSVVEVKSNVPFLIVTLEPF